MTVNVVDTFWFIPALLTVVTLPAEPLTVTDVLILVICVTLLEPRLIILLVLVPVIAKLLNVPVVDVVVNGDKEGIEANTDVRLIVLILLKFPLLPVKAPVKLVGVNPGFAIDGIVIRSNVPVPDVILVVVMLLNEPDIEDNVNVLGL